MVLRADRQGRQRLVRREHRTQDAAGRHDHRVVAARSSGAGVE